MIRNSVRRIASVLNYMYDNVLSYERALVNSQIPSAQRRQVSAVQEQVIGTLKDVVVKRGAEAFQCFASPWI